MSEWKTCKTACVLGGDGPTVTPVWAVVGGLGQALPWGGVGVQGSGRSSRHTRAMRLFT